MGWNDGERGFELRSLLRIGFGSSTTFGEDLTSARLELRVSRGGFEGNGVFSASERMLESGGGLFGGRSERRADGRS